MSLIDNIKESLGLVGVPSEPFLRVALIGGGEGCFCSAYIENVRLIKSYSTDQICVAVKGGQVTLLGEGLCIKKYCQGDLAVCGKIKSVVKD